MKKTAFLGTTKKPTEKRRCIAIAILSCFVFFCTAYMLILPATTMENGALPQNLAERMDGAIVTEHQSKPVATTLPTAINVSLDWTTLPTSGNMMVTLYKDGYPTDKVLTLNGENGWKGGFYDLDAGNYHISYTVMDGYEYSVNGETKENYEFTQTDSLKTGNTYILVHGSNQKQALQNNRGTSLTGTNITVSDGVISEAEDSIQWYFNGTSLKNAATSNYLKLNTAGASTDSAVQNHIVYENGHIRRTDSTSRYLIWYNNAYTSTTVSAYATPFTLYAKSNGTATVHFEITGNKVENNNGESDRSSFEHNKTIDYLGDGIPNPDTDLSGPDRYRLYLDMTGKQEPVDLLIVVDGSGSMSKTDVDNMRRDAAITKFLNGSTVSSNSNGFLAYFLNMNRENKVSVIQFYGKTADRDSHYVSNSAIDYTYDSTVLLDWTEKNRFVNCANQNNSGTNYEAGLKRAANQFSAVSDDRHKKIMIFLSDGVPTYFQIDRNDVGTVCGGYTLKASDVGKRWGTGSYTSTANYPYCKNPSKKAFDDFISSMPDVTVFTIGVSADISETSQSESQSPEVLKYMAEQGNGVFLSVISSMDELKLKLQSVFYPKGVIITDNLSKYVRYYDEKPDVLVTMTDHTTGTVTELYRYGKLTSAATGILTDVVYTAGDPEEMPTGSTGIIRAIFDAGYQLKPEYTYTLSFNVQTTQTAYNEYYSDGYNATGDAGTDYGTNTTSSEKEGFYSNDSAFVSYNVSDSLMKEIYRKPVIQVQKPKAPENATLTVAKTVSGIKTTKSFPFELAVFNSEGDEIDFSGIKLPKGVSLKEKDGIPNVLEFVLADGESVAFEHLIPKGAELILTETEHDGYTVTMNVGDSGGFAGESQRFEIENELEITVINSAGVRLPETGSAGNLLLTSGGLLIIACACVYRCVHRCSRERRSE